MSKRRFARWLDNDRLDVHVRYAPLIQEALTAWGEATLYLALGNVLRVLLGYEKLLI